MTYYESPNDYSAYGCTNPFYWRVTAASHNPSEDKTYITIEFGYDGDLHYETRTIDGNHESNTEDAVIQNLLEYQNSTGPIHGGGFPIRK